MGMPPTTWPTGTTSRAATRTRLDGLAHGLAGRPRSRCRERGRRAFGPGLLAPQVAPETPGALTTRGGSSSLPRDTASLCRGADDGLAERDGDVPAHRCRGEHRTLGARPRGDAAGTRAP